MTPDEVLSQHIVARIVAHRPRGKYPRIEEHLIMSRRQANREYDELTASDQFVRVSFTVPDGQFIDDSMGISRRSARWRAVNVWKEASS